MKATLAFATLALISGLGGTPTPSNGNKPDPQPSPQTKPTESAQKPRMYTTYFYTAGEAVIHGYAPDTKVRIVALDKRGTIWEGKVGVGETRTVGTGQGVFGFLSDKKASILVGTPTSCAVVGYFLKDEEGSYRSNRFFAQLPSAMSAGDEHFIVWAYEPAHVEIYDRKTEKRLVAGNLAANGFLELPRQEMLGNRVLEIRSTGSKVAAEVYYDEGFIVPASNGRGSGKEFLVYAGSITNGVNDVNVVSQIGDANVTITDLQSQKVLFQGVVKRGGIHSLTLSQRYVRVQSDVAVNVVVAGFKHYQDGYAEHHFATGIEGAGIENDFLVTTSGELWLFSYYDRNPVTVTDARSGKQIFEGTLNAGAVRGLQPGFGLFHVKSRMGLSVMGGASACGADYSPAAGMFAVDEALFEVIAQVREARLREAAQQGKTISESAASAPMTDDEWKRYGAPARAKSFSKMSAEEANQRAMQYAH